MRRKRRGGGEPRARRRYSRGGLRSLLEPPDPSSRLFPHALRITGWSHKFANIIKRTMQQCSHWPAFLESIRSLVKFFRNRTYREHLARSLDGGFCEGAKAALKSFTAHLLEWRFETIYDCFNDMQVGPLFQQQWFGKMPWTVGLGNSWKVSCMTGPQCLMPAKMRNIG